MAYSLADMRHFGSGDRNSAMRWPGMEDGSSDNVFGDTTTSGSIAPQFQAASMMKNHLTGRDTSADSPSGTGLAQAPGRGVPVAAIVGASVAGGVVLLVAGLCVYFLWWKRRKPGRMSTGKDEEVVYFPDTHPLMDHTDPVTFPPDSESNALAHPLTYSPDPDTDHLLAYPNTPPLLGSAAREYFPSAPASSRSTSVAASRSASLSMSALGASPSLSQGGAGVGIGPLAALGEAARSRMDAGNVEALRSGMGAGVESVADSGGVHVAESPSAVRAGYEVRPAMPHLHSMQASVALASSASTSSVPSTSASSAVSRGSTRTVIQPRRWNEEIDGASS